MDKIPGRVRGVLQPRGPGRGELAVETSGLTKTFGKTRAVDGVDLAVPAGCIYGFLGPNGAGKTTTIRILATLLRPDAGTARVLGHDVVHEAAAVRRRVSLTGQFAAADQDLTAAENLVLLGRLWGHSWRDARRRARELVEAFGLADVAGRQVGLLSGGMRRRLDIAASLIVIPDLLFLDEPTAGLDPAARQQVWATVRAVAAGGATVLLTTQYLDEADRLADRIALIDHGTVIAEGTSGQLKAAAGAGTVRVRLADPAQRARAQRVLAADLGVPVHPGSDPAVLAATVPAAGGQATAGEQAAHALAGLSHSGIAVSECALGQPSLDEVFLALTGHRAQTQAITARAVS
jgi:ABC-2 type transport system ATP-binding protein